MGRLTAALARLRAARSGWFSPERVPQNVLWRDVVEVHDAHTGHSVDLDQFMNAITDYVERIELDPTVPVDVCDIAPRADWDLLYSVGLGARVLLHATVVCEVMLARRYAAQIIDDYEQTYDEALSQLRSTDAQPQLDPAATNVADVVIRQQLASQYGLEPDDIPGLSALEPAVLFGATQAVLVAFDLTLRRLARTRS